MQTHHPNIPTFRFLLYTLTLVCLLGGASCKKKKQVVESAPTGPTPEETRIADAKAALERLLNSPPSRNMRELEAKESDLADIKAMGIQDGEIFALIRQVEAKLAKERANLEAQAVKDKEMMAYDKLEGAFSAIANAGNLNIANAKINETMDMFSSSEALVLIIINESGGIKDYDRPTTIAKYLNYLKDQHKNANTVENIVYDARGKIKELELKKK